MNIEKEIRQIRKAVDELVYDKSAIKKAYNYYHGHRDVDQFKHIEENYGIGVPTGVSFNPLVRPHLDRLIGEYIGLNQDLTISCKDQETITNIMRDKQAKSGQEVFNYLKGYLENTIITSIINNTEVTTDPFIASQIQKIQSNINESFVSEYEIAAKNLLDYFKQSKNIDLENKMQSLLTDLCISGTCYYRVRPSLGGNNVQLEILNPLHTFVEKNPNSDYLADSYRAVIRRYMSTEDILMEYHEDLKPEHIKILRDRWEDRTSHDGDFVYVTASSSELKGS